MNIQNILGYGSFAGISTMFIHEAYQKIHTIDPEKEKYSSLKKIAYISQIILGLGTFFLMALNLSPYFNLLPNKIFQVLGEITFIQLLLSNF